MKRASATPPNYQSPVPVVSSFNSSRPSLMGPAPPGVPPLHNTVTIVQQPTGQSLYVQQQIFTPSPYIPPVTMTTQVEPYMPLAPVAPRVPTIIQVNCYLIIVYDSVNKLFCINYDSLYQLLPATTIISSTQQLLLYSQFHSCQLLAQLQLIL